MRSNPFKLRSLIILLVILLLGLSGCGQIVSGGSFTLGNGQQVTGSLIILSNNADLQEGSLVAGSVIQVCCNLTVNGKVKGGIQMVTGNIMLGPTAQIGRDINLVTGDFMQSPESQIAGQVTNGPSAGMFLSIILILLLSLVIIPGLVISLIYAALRVILRKPVQNQSSIK